MQKIIRKIWKGDLSPGQGLNLIQDEMINIRHKLKGLNGERILYILEAAKEKVMRIQEAQKEIEEILDEIKSKIKRKSTPIYYN